MKMGNIPRETDVLIVGGGPAGLATALAVRQKGLRAVVADSAAPHIDKACGEGLMPDSIAALAALGVELDRRHYVPFKGIRFIGSESCAEAQFPRSPGAGIRRVALHDALVEHAAAAGVHLAWRHRISDVSGHSAYLNGRLISYRWIVGADGGNSIMRRSSGLDAGEPISTRYGFRRHYKIQPWTDFMELHWAKGCQTYVTPVSDSEVCVALISRDSQLRIDGALPLFPNLARRLADAIPSSPERGAVSATRKLRRVQIGNLALAGDASGSVDAVTGEGLCLAFRQSIALAGAMAAGDLTAYETAHRRIRFRPAMMAEMLLWMDRNQWVQSRALAALSKRPRVFSRLLAMHIGAASAGDIATSVFKLGWSILTL